MRKLLASIVTCLSLASCEPAFAEQDAMCRKVDVQQFITAATKRLPMNLVGARAKKFAEDAHTGIDLSAVFFFPGFLVVVFEMPDGSGGRACVTVPDDDDEAAIRKHFGVAA